jgi:hypothetical protein
MKIVLLKLHFYRELGVKDYTMPCVISVVFIDSNKNISVR